MCLLICTDFSVERCDQFKLLLLHILDINKTPQRFTMTEKGCTKTLNIIAIIVLNINFDINMSATFVGHSCPSV